MTPNRVAQIRSALAILLASCVAVVVLGNTDAGAVGTTHKLSVSPRSAGSAVEGAARVSFSCNDATLAFTVTVRNVQVIGADGVTPWPHATLLPTAFDVTWLLLPANGLNDGPIGIGTIAIVQNRTNGLFNGQVKGQGLLSAQNSLETGACATGGLFLLFGPGESLTLCNNGTGPCALQFGNPFITPSTGTALT